MRKAIAVAALLLTAGSASAAPAYGTAGCGLGSVLFGSQPGFVQVVAATTNGIFGNQTFGITTGTLNCGPPATPAGARLFIDVNREALAKDMARGSGETIATLTQLTGCSDAKVVGATLQKNFSSIIPNEKVSSDIVADNVLATLKADKQLSCSAI
ncbi:MAG: DUF3015 family protein [Myxococcales bacterium]|nr:DUF3015 domain-containing protein [Myxococcales bacterium]